MRPTATTKAHFKSYFVVLVAGVFFWQQSVSLSLADPISPQSTEAPELKINVLEGEDGVNIIKTKTAVKPVVEVRDKNNLPVAGAYVTFLAPDSGPHVLFAHGRSSFSTLTDASGRATVHTMKPAGPGAFKIRVQASFQGKTAKATIAQTNYATLAAATAAGAGAAAGAGTAAGGGISGLMMGLIAAGVAAGVVTAVALAKSGGGKPTGTIGAPGTPTIGPP